MNGNDNDMSRHTIRAPHQAGTLTVEREPEPTSAQGDLTDALIARDFWSEQELQQAGIPIRDVELVTVGGGIGSFVAADYLRIFGVSPDKIKVLTQLDYPWQTYEYLTRVSQIPVGERLRSDSASRPDCLWGFPSYAFSEAFHAKNLRDLIAPIFQVLTEPIFTDYYTPKAGHVFGMLRREADRISYDQLVEKGLVRMVRRRAGGGYFTILTPPAGTSPTKRVAYRSKFVHIAVGYPGLKFLPDLQDYRQRYNDFRHVVNAYEPHEHVYQELNQRPGTVILRGGGIVASRILQRLTDDRDRSGAQTQIIHLFRTYVTTSHGPSIFMRRHGANGWAYQGFNYPKSAWGGQLWAQMRKLEGKEREALYKVIGGTNTPKRKLWLQQLDRGRREGWYRTMVGEVDSVVPGTTSGTITRIKTKDGLIEIPADYIVDGTGLEADIAEHRLLADLLEHGGAGRNPLGRLDVERTFEVKGTRSGAGRMYAVGAPTLGGYFPGVDTFLGLQLATQEVVDDLVRQGFAKRLGPMRSTQQWLRWARNKKI